MRKILKLIICLIICLGILVPAQGESGFETRDAKAYESVENIYKMDFSVSDLKEYTSKDEWAISSASSAEIVNGKLTCKSGRSFSIRPGFTIGDDYGLEPGYFTFDLVMTGGQISIGTRLFTNVTIKGTQGLWFTLTNDKLVVEDPSTKLKETIDHGMDLSTEQNVRISDNLDTIEFRISDNLICSVTIENEKIMLFDANGNELANYDNVRLAKSSVICFVSRNAQPQNFSYNLDNVVLTIEKEDAPQNPETSDALSIMAYVIFMAFISVLVKRRFAYN